VFSLAKGMQPEGQKERMRREKDEKNEVKKVKRNQICIRFSQYLCKIKQTPD
jgi:hypothetical protein